MLYSIQEADKNIKRSDNIALIEEFEKEKDQARGQAVNGQDTGVAVNVIQNKGKVRYYKERERQGGNCRCHANR